MANEQSEVDLQQYSDSLIPNYANYQTPDLADWFNLRKYAAIKDFEFTNWLWHLNIRHNMFFLLDTMKSKLKDFEDESVDHEKKKLGNECIRHKCLIHAVFEHVREHPLTKLNENIPKLLIQHLYPQTEHKVAKITGSRAPDFEPSGFRWIPTPRERLDKGIKELTYIDWLFLGVQLPTQAKEPLINAEHGLILEDSIYEFSNENEYWSDSTLRLVVNLNTPDKLLIKEFKNHLKRCRKQSQSIWTEFDKTLAPGAQRLHNPDLKAWRRQELLPCIDIVLWELEKQLADVNFKLKNEDYLNHLYSKDSEGRKGDKGLYDIKKDIKLVTSLPYLDYLSRVIVDGHIKSAAKSQ